MQDVLTRTPPPYDVRLRYGADANQFGDLRLPKGESPFPVLMMIHGGFWRAKYDLAHAGHLCAALAAEGIATWNIEYRRVGNPGGGWPGTFDDVLAACRYIRQQGNQHGLHPERLAVMGHSAGGQLALCLAAHEPSLEAAIALAGVVDLKRAYELHLSNDAAAEFLGGSPQQVPEHYAEASPVELPIPSLNQVLIHGTVDDVVPVAFSRDYVRAKHLRKEHVTLTEIPDAGHFDIIDPQSRAWAAVLRSVRSCFR
jgi:acetyl esterase/lipase